MQLTAAYSHSGLFSYVTLIFFYSSNSGQLCSIIYKLLDVVIIFVIHDWYFVVGFSIFVSIVNSMTMRIKSSFTVTDVACVELEDVTNFSTVIHANCVSRKLLRIHIK